jgi:hypothetical protein
LETLSVNSTKLNGFQYDFQYEATTPPVNEMTGEMTGAGAAGRPDPVIWMDRLFCLG